MPVFNETQRFNQWWMHLILGGLFVFLLVCLYRWFVMETAIGNVSASDTTGQIIVILTLVPVIIFLYSIKLRTAIDEIGVHYQFYPLHLSSKTIRWSELQKCYVRKYSPIKEFGGWGYRISWGTKGKAFNISGNKGIQLIVMDGKKLLLGTQKSDDAQQVINNHFTKDKDPIN